MWPKKTFLPTQHQEFEFDSISMFHIRKIVKYLLKLENFGRSRLLGNSVGEELLFLKENSGVGTIHDKIQDNTVMNIASYVFSLFFDFPL